MITSSKYLQLSPYALLEYVYNDTVISTTNSSFLRIKNAFTGNISYVGYNPTDWTKPRDLTGNILDRTVQQVGDAEWVMFDMDRPITYFEKKYQSIYFEHLWGAFPSETNITYDSVKIYLQSGYSFSNLAGFILRTAVVDNTDQQLFTSNIGFLKEDENIHYLTRPLTMGDKFYDRYVMVKVPSLKYLQTISSDISGEYGLVDNLFIKRPFEFTKSRINVIFYEVREFETDRDGQLILRTPIVIDEVDSSIVRIELGAEDEFINIGAVIQESEAGDYFEIFPTYNEGFLDTFIFNQAATGEEYLVIHEVEVYEHTLNAGIYTELLSQRFTQIQDEGFDKPFVFRPVVKDNATLSFSIDYSVRILNRNDGTQIIRKASINYPDGKKYGRWLPKLDLNFGFNPIKIVNKILRVDKSGIYDNPNIYNLMAPNSTQETTITTSVGLPISFNKICINSSTLFVDGISNRVIIDGGVQINTSTLNLKEFMKSDVIYGQGEGVIYLNEFDNFIKFEVYKFDRTNDNVPELYENLSDSSNIFYYLVFEGLDGELIKIPQLKETNNLNIEVNSGELLFKISSTNAKTILKSPNSQFNIVLESVRQIKDISEGTTVRNEKEYEMVFYTGYFDSINNYKLGSSPEYMVKENLLAKKLTDIKNKELQYNNMTNEFKGFLNSADKLVTDSNQRALLSSILEKLDNIK